MEECMQGDYICMAWRDSSRSAGAAVLCGILFHFATIPLSFEFELVMFHFIAAYIVTFLGGVFGFVNAAGYGILAAFAKAVLLAGCFNTGVLASMSVYRLFFHRTRNFPGPIPAKLTRFYAMQQSAKNMQYYKELDEMHAEYGDFVRTGPREISILRKEAIPIIYGPKTECRKSSWYGQAGNDPKKASINTTRDKASYRLRRRAWDRGFSSNSLKTYEPRIKAKVDTLIDQLQKRAGTPTDIAAWSMFFAFDLMGDLGFGKEFDNMISGKEHPAIKAIHEFVGMIGILGSVPWLLNILGSIPGAAAAFAEMSKISEDQMKSREQTLEGEKTPQDIASWLLKAQKENDPSAPPSHQALTDDSRVVILAGSDTTSTTLASVLFYLAKEPSVQGKLQTLIDKEMPGGYESWSYEKVKSITYIDDIINEALRLKPPVINIPTRETPPQGIQVGKVYIPGNVNVMVPTILIQRDPRYWEDAKEFIPERWGESRAEMGTDEAPFFAFSLGMHSCIGQNLAYLSLRTSISSIVQNFDISFAPGEMGEAFDKEFLDTVLMTLKPLRLQFTPRS